MEDEDAILESVTAAPEARLTSAPVLSTPAEHLFEHVEPLPNASETTSDPHDDGLGSLASIYETGRTARDIEAGGLSRVALQFPDAMLRDAPRVVGLLKEELDKLYKARKEEEKEPASTWPGKIYILADTSYSACCVDEIAAEHVDADVVVHYGRSCLSPTARLPVLYVFTQQQLDVRLAADALEKEIPEKTARIILMADITYQSHVPAVFSELLRRGYTNVRATEVVHNPNAPIPNRTFIQQENSGPGSIDVDAAAAVGVDANAALETPELQEFEVFHISAPPTSLLLSLCAKVGKMHIYSTSPDSSLDYRPTTSALLSRRYAKVLSLATAGVIGILINTLSVANYLASVDSIRKRIAAAGKKSYTIVVGKLNPAKLANFAEIDGWVVVGCWESSLVEEDASYFRPVITPFELEIALMPDEGRIWGHRWWGGIEGAIDPAESDGVQKTNGNGAGEIERENEQNDHGNYSFDQDVDEDESAPPEFDLRTGRLVSHSRPMQVKPRSMNGVTNGDEKTSNQQDGSKALALRPKAEVALINGVVSPGAEFLRSQRQWQGLGSDFEGQERSSAIEEGRSGIASGYTVGHEIDKR